MTTAMLKNDDKVFIKDVLTHYKKFGRHDLIWRKSITAYRVLVSEVMLQQTQVTRVVPKFEAWIKTYPTLSLLGKSTLRDVLVLWQGLGYQRRAKALLHIAQENKSLPKTYYGLLALHGVGRYTASAITAFAYDQFSHPVLETNIRTALIEYFHQGETDIHDGVLYDDLARLEKEGRVKKVGARNWYYALMDFGAYLKSKQISHNKKSKHYSVQSAYKGSFRELRAKTLFAITHKNELPKDVRLEEAVSVLLTEGYIKKTRNGYRIS
jgi:A/G-specific adenine glycosylase